MLTTILVDEKKRIYWVHGNCSCGEPADFLVTPDPPPMAEPRFECQCGDVYPLNRLIKEGNANATS